MPASFPLRIGTAGWSLMLRDAPSFPSEGSHLQRYAQVFNAAEINSSFHRPHRRSTYERWAASVPDDFHFAAKLPRLITHDLALRGARKPFATFLGEAGGLGRKLAALLVQLPPKLVFECRTAAAFFKMLRGEFPRDIVCEPRHVSWFGDGAEEAFAAHKVSRVAADPVRKGATFIPGGTRDIAYFRLHGSPRMYYSSYTDECLAALAAQLQAAEAKRRWCIFDNTASGVAIGNALTLQRLLQDR
ncbi:MAG: DUF72 domain-containing protein [Pseudolabrys sp.]|nr:DUF72 domain-containing protein [Bradyrhizobium sp.]MBV9347312.1 DUF72 domain-containing protein [Pseudolabrys sp.]MBV9955442.1 DUF72 domain-containing protein [Pseudolabrys sp.]